MNKAGVDDTPAFAVVILTGLNVVILTGFTAYPKIVEFIIINLKLLSLNY